LQEEVSFLACRRLDQLADPEHQEAVTTVIANRSPATLACPGPWRRRRAAVMAFYLVLLSWSQLIGDLAVLSNCPMCGVNGVLLDITVTGSGWCSYVLDFFKILGWTLFPFPLLSFA